MKKYIAVILSCVLMLSQSSLVFAAETDNSIESYKMMEETVPDDMFEGEGIDVMPLTLYLANIYTSIVKVNSTKVSIRAQTVCAEDVKSLTVIYTLQKKNGTKWEDVASATATTYDTSGQHKTYTISNVSSGTYRCKASAKATGYNGYSETLTGYSSSISI